MTFGVGIGHNTNFYFEGHIYNISGLTFSRRIGPLNSLLRQRQTYIKTALLQFPPSQNKILHNVTGQNTLPDKSSTPPPA